MRTHVSVAPATGHPAKYYFAGIAEAGAARGKKRLLSWAAQASGRSADGATNA